MKFSRLLNRNDDNMIIDKTYLFVTWKHFLQHFGRGWKRNIGTVGESRDWWFIHEAGYQWANLQNHGYMLDVRWWLMRNFSCYNRRLHHARHPPAKDKSWINTEKKNTAACRSVPEAAVFTFITLLYYFQLLVKSLIQQQLKHLLRCFPVPVGQWVH